MVELLEHGADPKMRDKEGRSALYEACRTGGSFAVEILTTIDARQERSRPGSSRLEPHHMLLLPWAG